MITEVGSEYWLQERPLDRRADIPGWLKAWGNVALTASGRGAFSLLLDRVENEVLTKVVLMPAYTCDSVIDPFRNKGYECLFYNCDGSLGPDLSDIEAYASKDIGIFVHMGYYGEFTNASLRDTIKRFNRSGTLVVEDVTHTLFSRNRMLDESDYYVCSLRKWTGIASGGFLASSARAIEERLPEFPRFYGIRREALLLKGEYIRSRDPETKEAYLAKFNESEELLFRDSNAYRMDDESRSLLHRLDPSRLKEIRRQNSAYLLNGMKDIPGVTPVFRSYDEDSCPFFVPIFIDDYRQGWREKLIGEKIYCPVHWPIPAAIHNERFASTISVMNRILSIPSDQRYDISDMKRVIEVLKKISEEMQA
ncbi:hypothetical protein [Cohnella yongneupensis]|uniref:dTDP-4-amino-4,6-dideoxygalactose transaminase n=1 Tax=Cohnella yongneupensis TaxID=425006 RepID=A0ABW0R4B1_9BACL